MLEKDMELYQVVYNILVTQIEFGTYRYADHLPTIEEASRFLQVSWDTVRAAYLRLKHNGNFIIRFLIIKVRSNTGL